MSVSPTTSFVKKVGVRNKSAWLSQGYRPAAVFMAVIMLVFSVSACEIRTRMGEPIKIAALEDSLGLEQSTKDDIRRVLGRPFAKGKTMMPFHQEPRTTWTYLYSEGDMKDAGTAVLFVYFDKQKYSGYMWYSSLKQK